MKKPMFSVIIPTLNEEKFLPNLLQSLVEQPDQDFEVLVVDGRSKDNTKEAALKFKNKLPNLKFITAPRPGVSLQRNLGAKESQGEYLILIDADSVILPYFFERIKHYIQTTHPTVFTTWCRADGETSEDAFAALIGNATVEGSIMLHRPWTPGPLTIVKRTAFDDVGGYDEAISFGEDHDLGMRLYEKKHPLMVLRETLYEYSMRRLRKEGKMRLLPKYLRGALSVIITKHGPGNMPDYVTGGHLYDEKNKRKKDKNSLNKVLHQFQSNLKTLVKEFFA